VSVLGDLGDRIVWAAPMAGGVTTVPLVTAATQSGGIGFLAGGYTTATHMEKQIIDVKDRVGSHPFGVNVFVPGPHAGNARQSDELDHYRELLTPDAKTLDVCIDMPVGDQSDQWGEKIDVILHHNVPIISFTFGIPPTHDIQRLRRARTIIVGTATSRDEAEAWVHAGADILCIQGPLAGGHRATHTELEFPGTQSLLSLLENTRTLGVPLVAAGGIANAADVRTVLSAGAQAVQVGTALIRATESGAHPAHKVALAAGKTTVLTRAFSGRIARGIPNSFTHRFGKFAPPLFPEVNTLTKNLRTAAAQTGDPELMSLWTGTGLASAQQGPASTVITSLLP
jgi:nitronate monooxygenase